MAEQTLRPGDRVVLHGTVVALPDSLEEPWATVVIDGDGDDTPVHVLALRHAEPVERAAPWPPPSGPREVWQSSLWPTWAHRTTNGAASGYATATEALRRWHEARR